MKALTLTLILAVASSAQQIAVWNDASKSYVAVKAGAGIKIDLAAKTISATAAKVRAYGVVLPYQPISRGWSLPSGAIASSVAIWCNGMRYTPGIDYVVASGLITATDPSRMTIDALVVADYDR